MNCASAPLPSVVLSWWLLAVESLRGRLSSSPVWVLLVRDCLTDNLCPVVEITDCKQF